MDKYLITHNIELNSGDIESKRLEIREYFLKTYELFEKQFEIFTNDSVFYERPEPLGKYCTYWLNWGNYIGFKDY